MEDAHTKSIEEVILHFKTDDNSGLSDEQIKQYQEKYGPNGKRKSKHYACMFLHDVGLCDCVCFYNI